MSKSSYHYGANCWSYWSCMASSINTCEYHVWLQEMWNISSQPWGAQEMWNISSQPWGEVTDRQLAPSALFTADHSSATESDTSPVNQSDTTSDASMNQSGASAHTSSITSPDTSSVNRLEMNDRDSDYWKKYEEGYDVYSDDYLQWMQDNNLLLPTSDSQTSSSQPLSSSKCESTSSLSEILSLPKPVNPKKKQRKPAVNAKARCITDLEVLEELKQHKEEKEEKEKQKQMKQYEKEKRKEERERKKEKQKMKERKKQEQEKKEEREKKKKYQEENGKRHGKKQAEAKKRQTKPRGSKKSSSASVTELQESFSHLNIRESEDSGEESEAECPDCGLVYGSAEDHQEWVQCDGCGGWWDMVCAGVEKENITQIDFFCSKCM